MYCDIKIEGASNIKCIVPEPDKIKFLLYLEALFMGWPWEVFIKMNIEYTIDIKDTINNNKLKNIDHFINGINI